MAKYGQLHPADFFRADASGLGRDYALALAWITQSELEDVPAREFRRSLEKLRKIGIEMTLESVLGKTLAERIRKNRHRSKSKDMADKKDVPKDVTCDVPEDDYEGVPEDASSRIRSRIRKSSPTEKKAPAAPRAKRAPMEERPLPDDWTPSPTHRAFAEAHGIDVDIEAFAFREWAQGRMLALPNGRFATWLGKTAAQKKNAPTIKKASPPGWNDGDMMMGIPKGKSWP